MFLSLLKDRLFTAPSPSIAFQEYKLSGNIQTLKVFLIKGRWVSEYVFSRLLRSNSSRMF